jgi:hypothetical protein
MNLIEAYIKKKCESRRAGRTRVYGDADVDCFVKEVVNELVGCLPERPPRAMKEYADSHDFAHAQGENCVMDVFENNLKKLVWGEK